MATYNLSAYDTIYTPLDLVQASNNVSELWMTNLFLLLLWVLIVMGFKSYDTKATMAVASVLTTIVGLYFFLNGLILWQTFGICILSLAVFVLIYFWGKGEN